MRSDGVCCISVDVMATLYEAQDGAGLAGRGSLLGTGKLSLWCVCHSGFRRSSEEREVWRPLAKRSIWLSRCLMKGSWIFPRRPRAHRLASKGVSSSAKRGKKLALYDDSRRASCARSTKACWSGFLKPPVGREGVVSGVSEDCTIRPGLVLVTEQVWRTNWIGSLQRS